MSIIALPARLETPPLDAQIGVVELPPRWGPPIWTAEPPTERPESTAVVEPSWMMVALAFYRVPA